MDELDTAILGLLGRDGRMSFTSIAARLGLSEGTIRNRVQRMTANGMLVIVALCNPLSLGLQAIRLFVSVDAPSHIEDVCLALARIRHTNRVSAGSGTRQIYVELTCRDLAEAQLVLDEVRGIPGIAEIQTSVLTRFDKDHSWRGLRGGSGQQRGHRAGTAGPSSTHSYQT